MISDSHSRSISLGNTFPGEDLILFDAHCDLGYTSADAVYREKADGVCQCSSWAWHAVESGKVSNLLIVYPDWRGLSEWETMKDLFHIQELGGRVRAITWSDFVLSSMYRDISAIHISRSSAWTPPWCDKQFNEFVRLWGNYICLDCAARLDLVGFDACSVREFDKADAHALFDAEQKVVVLTTISLIPVRCSACSAKGE